MLLRWLVSQLLRQAAQQKLQETVVEKARQHLGREMAAASEAPSPDDEPFVCQAAVLFALGIEAGGTVDLLDQPRSERGKGWTARRGRMNDKQIAVAETGVGHDAAARAARAVIDHFHPPWIISAGFAGALREDLRRGHVLMANGVADESGDALSIGLMMDEAALAATPGVHVGRLLSVDRIIRKPDERRALAATHDALACDMETMAVARACAERKVRFLSVRIISDTVDDVLPPEVEKLVGRSSLATKMGVATGALFNRPSVVKDLWKLRESAVHASDRLGRFLAGVIEQLDS